MRLVVLFCVSACASHIKREPAGAGIALVQPRGAAAPAAAAAGIALARGNYEFALRFDVPRAQVIEYAVTCAGAEQRGQIGETLEAYRARRLAELRAEREREKKTVAAVTGTVVGAVAPDVHARAQTSGPGGTATADAHVSGQAVGAAAGQAVADATVQEVVELPAGDVGAGRLETRVAMSLASDATCAVTAIADDSIRTAFDVVRLRDLDAEARERAVVAVGEARKLRGTLTAQLVGYGADPEARAKRIAAEEEARRLRLAAEEQARRARLAAEEEARQRQLAIDAQLRAQQEVKLRAEAQVRAEAEAKLRAEAQVRAEAEARLRAEVAAKAEAKRQAALAIELRRRDAALHARAELVAYLVGTCHADPNRRERELEARRAREAEIEAQRRAREAQLRIELEARAAREAQIEAQRRAREAQLRIELEARAAREAQIEAQRRAREAELDAQRRAREAELEAQRRAREAELEAQRRAREAELEAQRRAKELERARRAEAALGVRAQLVAYLVSIGARERPPMPAAIAESPGAAPFSGAVWVAGRWIWSGSQWQWEAGGWKDTTMFGATGSFIGGASVGAASVGAAITVGTDDVPTAVESTRANPPAVESRDHRTSTPPRDHRSDPQPTTSRDHRTGQTESAVRDHRKDDKKDDEPNVRDHRKK